MPFQENLNIQEITAAIWTVYTEHIRDTGLYFDPFKRPSFI